MVKRYKTIFTGFRCRISPRMSAATLTAANMAKSGMNPKTLQYLMGHSDIGVTLNTYTHLGLEDAMDELKRVEELENARKEMEKINGEGTVSQKMSGQYNMGKNKGALLLQGVFLPFNNRKVFVIIIVTIETRRESIWKKKQLL